MTTATAPARQWSRSEATLHFDVAASLVGSSGGPPHPFARAPRWRSSKPLHASSASAASAGPERPKSAAARVSTSSSSPVWLERDRATQQHSAAIVDNSLQRRTRTLEVENFKLRQELAKWMRCLDVRQEEVTTLRESVRQSGEEAGQWRASAQRYMVEAEQAREEASQLRVELAAVREAVGGAESCSLAKVDAARGAPPVDASVSPRLAQGQGSVSPRLAQGQGDPCACGWREAERGMDSQLPQPQRQLMLTGPADFAVIGSRPLGAESLRPPPRTAAGHKAAAAAQSCALMTPAVTPRSTHGPAEDSGDEPPDYVSSFAARAGGGYGHSIGHVAARRPPPHMNTNMNMNQARVAAHRPAPQAQRRALQVAVTIPMATHGYTRGSAARKPSVPLLNGGECGERGTA